MIFIEDKIFSIFLGSDPRQITRCLQRSVALPRASPVGGHEIPVPSGTRELQLIVWAAAHAEFNIRFPKTHHVFGAIIFNKVCGFKTKERPWEGKVL